MSHEQEPLQQKLFEEKIIFARRRLVWDNDMLTFLEERKKQILIELKFVEGQITSVEEDKKTLWEIINGEKK